MVPLLESATCQPQSSSKFSKTETVRVANAEEYEVLKAIALTLKKDTKGIL
jgi:hypothetical protein